MAVIGVDNGVSGAMVFLNGSGVCRGIPNPFRASVLRPILDADRFSDFVWDALPQVDEVHDPLSVWIEVPQIRMGKGGPAGGMNSRKTVSSIWWMAACLEQSFRSWGFPIHYCQPKDWQAAILHPFLGARGEEPPKGKGAHDRWKEVAVEYVQGKYGDRLSLLPSPRHRVPSSGLADACCIAEYALTNPRPYAVAKPKATKRRKTDVVTAG